MKKPRNFAFSSSEEEMRSGLKTTELAGLVCESESYVYCLICLTGHQAGQTFDLSEKVRRFWVGNSPHIEISIDLPELFPKHAFFEWNDKGELFLQSLQEDSPRAC